MTDAVLVLNAGSSSLKFSVFLDAEGALEPFLGGQIESLVTAPRFLARSAAGATVGERAWEAGTEMGHEGAIQHLFEWGRGHLGGHRIAAVGHRVGHGGTADHLDADCREHAGDLGAVGVHRLAQEQLVADGDELHPPDGHRVRSEKRARLR